MDHMGCMPDIPGYKLGEIIFRLPKDRENVRRIILGMNCSKICCQGSFIVFIEQSQYSQIITGIGYYEWDITGLINKMPRRDPVKLSVYSSLPFNQYGCPAEITEYFDSITVSLQTESAEWKKHITLTENCVSLPETSYSEWINTLDFDSNIYYLRNLGSSDINASVINSPDKASCMTDSGPFTVRPGETAAISPLRLTKFVRLSLQNACLTEPNPLIIYFIAVRR